MWVLILSSSAASHFWLVTFVFWLAGAQRDSSVQRESSICSLPKKTISTRSKIITESSLYRFSKVYLLPSYNKTSVRSRQQLFFLLDVPLFSWHTGQNWHIATLEQKLDWTNQVSPFYPHLASHHLFACSSPHVPRKSFSTCNKNDTIKRFPFVMGFHSVSSCFVFVFYHLYTLSLHHAHIQNFTWSSWKTVRKLFYVQFCYYSEFSPFVSSITIKWSSVHITHIKMCVYVCVGAYVSMFAFLRMRKRTSANKDRKGAKMFQQLFWYCSSCLTAGVALMALLWKVD